MNRCPCDFVSPLATFSAAWHSAHRDHHLAVFPDVDQGTRDNLAEFIATAERRQAVAS